MIWDRPWALTLLILLPFVLSMAWRTRSTVHGAQKSILVLLQLAAFTLVILALAGPWPEQQITQTTRVVLSTPSARATAEQVAKTWRKSTPQRDPFYVGTAGATPALAPQGDLTLPVVY